MGVIIAPGAVYVVVTNLTIYGLLIVSDTVMDPFGDDLEDFAVVSRGVATGRRTDGGSRTDSDKRGRGSTLTEACRWVYSPANRRV